MVTPIVSRGPTGPAPVEPSRLEATKTRPRGDLPRVDKVEAPAQSLAELGPPIDATRVNEIRAAIASGSYTIDADRLARAMMALDLPAPKA